ncbi:MAG: ImmA/IrrE family metallo-endopeptidase [Chloroflexi bacterium]|nr:ImmA/IrrE family metallo-endopeptidase [Chloroflexota bacterium]
MEARIIKSEAEYEAALAHVETLMDAAPDSPAEAELELFAMLVEQYEEVHYPIDLPDPIEAIKFRMEQSGLTRKDLALFLGSQSKVSEVLNYKRPLSLVMIRSLHEGLGIPAEVLLQESGRALEARQYDYRDYPFTEMFKQGYLAFNGTLQQAKDQAEELLIALFSVFGDTPPQPIYYKNAEKETDTHALIAWQAKAITLALQEDLPPFSQENLTEDFIREVIKLSYYSQGPQIAQEALNKKGIHLIVLPHLPHTYLDGACFSSPTGRPIIGVTLRHDRLDNFWFTLAHELAHSFLHLSQDTSAAFFDDTEYFVSETDDPQETEANHFARDILIPPEAWEQERTQLLESSQSQLVQTFAERVGVAPAVIAGRVRWETENYTKFAQLLGYRQVREQFAEYD